MTEPFVGRSNLVFIDEQCPITEEVWEALKDLECEKRHTILAPTDVTKREDSMYSYSGMGGMSAAMTIVGAAAAIRSRGMKRMPISDRASVSAEPQPITAEMAEQLRGEPGFDPEKHTHYLPDLFSNLGKVVEAPKPPANIAPEEFNRSTHRQYLRKAGERLAKERGNYQGQHLGTRRERRKAARDFAASSYKSGSRVSVKDGKIQFVEVQL